MLIDTYQYLRRKGLAVEDAVVRTAAQRIRPVLLTTATTILGLLPMVFELNVDFAAGTITRGSTTSDWWVLLSSAVVYGLAFSTILTLVLTPVLLAAPTVLRKNTPATITRITNLPLVKGAVAWIQAVFEKLRGGPKTIEVKALARQKEDDYPHAAE